LKSDRPHSFLEFGAKSGKQFINISQKNAKFELFAIELMKFINSIAKNVLATFDEKIEIRERCKGVHCVDLGEGGGTREVCRKVKKMEAERTRKRTSTGVAKTQLLQEAESISR